MGVGGRGGRAVHKRARFRQPALPAQSGPQPPANWTRLSRPNSRFGAAPQRFWGLQWTASRPYETHQQVHLRTLSGIASCRLHATGEPTKRRAAGLSMRCTLAWTRCCRAPDPSFGRPARTAGLGCTNCQHSRACPSFKARVPRHFDGLLDPTLVVSNISAGREPVCHKTHIPRRRPRHLRTLAASSMQRRAGSRARMRASQASTSPKRPRSARRRLTRPMARCWGLREVHFWKHFHLRGG